MLGLTLAKRNMSGKLRHEVKQMGLSVLFFGDYGMDGCQAVGCGMVRCGRLGVGGWVWEVGCGRLGQSHVFEWIWSNF